MNKPPTKVDPVTGPLSREEFTALVQAPFGKARKTIQKHDPFWGRGEGEKIEYEVRCHGSMHGTAYVKATSQEEADKLADELSENEVDWDGGSDDFTILSVEPYVQRS